MVRTSKTAKGAAATATATNSSREKDELAPHKKGSNATDSTLSSETEDIVSGDAKRNGTSTRNSLAERSLVERAKIFDQAYVESPRRRSKNKTGSDAVSDNSYLQQLLDESNHRKQSNVIHGRRDTYRNPSNPGITSMIVNDPTRKDPKLSALIDASQHRKERNVTDGVKPVYLPSKEGRKQGNKSKEHFSIIPKIGGTATPIKPMKMGEKMQQLLDASRHRRLMATDSQHRLAHRMMHSSEHTNPKSSSMFTFNLRKVKNRVKPSLPQGTTPLKPSEVLFPNVAAPKLNVDLQTYQPISYPKSKEQEAIIETAMKDHYILKHHLPSKKNSPNALVDVIEPVELRKGQILHRQGECKAEDDAMYVVEEGFVEVKVDGRVVDTIKEGQTFGEERLLLRQTNKATIQAGAGITKLLALPQVVFRAVLQKQYQAVMNELKAKRPQTNVSSTWRDDIYNKKDSNKERVTVEDEDEYSYEEYEEYTDEEFSEEDEDFSQVSDSFHGDDRTATASHVSSTRQAKQKKQAKRKHGILHNFENSPAVLELEALRKSAQKYAATKNDLEFIKVLGEGQFGEVWLVATSLLDQNPKKQQFALKKQQLVSEDDLEEDEEALVSREAILNEMDALKKLQHPFICHLVHTYESEDSIDMLLGLIPGGELWDQVHRERDDGTWISGIPEGRARFYAFVLADTLGYIHSKGYIFRDMKPENVMLDGDGYPIIVDFGFAKNLEQGEKTFTFCGTPNYVAPEIIANTGHAKEVDFWALGVVIYEMVSGENPFFYDGMEQFALYQAISEEDPYEMSDSVTATDQVRELTDLLFLKNPDERLGAEGAHEIMSHPWFLGMPNMADIHAKRISPDEASELVFEEYMSVGENDDSGTFSIEVESLKGVDSDVKVDLPRDFGKHGRSRSFDNSHRPLHQESIKASQRHVPESALQEEKTDEEVGTVKSPTKIWSPRKKGLGYFVNMKSPEQKRSSRSRRTVVGNFLSQYLEDVDVDDDHYLKKVTKSAMNDDMNKSCPDFDFF